MAQNPNKPPCAPSPETDSTLAPGTDTETNALIEAEIERAMRPYLDLLPKTALEAMRDVLHDALTTHPVAIKLIKHIKTRPPMQASGMVPIGQGLSKKVGEGGS